MSFVQTIRTAGREVGCLLLSICFVLSGCAGAQNAGDREPNARSGESATSNSGADETTDGDADGGSEANGPEEGGSEAGENDRGQPPEGGKRAHHYGFAHRIVPKLFFDRPEQLMMLMKTGRGEEALLEMWNRLGQQLDPERRIEVDSLPVQLTRSEVGGRTQFVAIIELPPPEGVAEAYMIGLVVRPEDGQLRATEGGKRSGTDYWYYTLERSVDLQTADRDRPRTVLGGWEGDKHLNHGEGPPPDVGKFREAIRKKVRREASAGGED